MSGRVLEIAVRPVRIAFLLGRNPSSRLINSVISVNSGLWGGMHNFICPTDGTAVAGEYLELLKAHSPDCIVFGGTFANKRNIIRELELHNIHPCFLHKRIRLESVERFGIGIEGIFDSRFLQSIRYGTFPYSVVVDPRLTSSTLIDRLMFGIPPNRLREYIRKRIDFITLTRYRKESQREESDFDEMISVIEMTGENLKAYRTVRGRRLTSPRYGMGRVYFVVGDKNSLEDTCYFWNLRAIFGRNLVRWLALDDLPSSLNKRELAYARIPTFTSACGALLPEIKSAIKESTAAQDNIRYTQPKAVLRLMANSVWQSELKREHIATSEGECVFPVSRPSSFELVYPPRYSQRWAVDLRVIRDDTIGTEGFVLPNLSCLSDMMTPGRGGRVHPRMRGDTLSLQVTSARIDEHMRLVIPGDWEVIRATFKESDYRICLSDQGNYMARALALFGGLARLASLLRDVRATIIFDEFVKHHRTKERITATNRYRRALTLDDMRRVVMSLMGSKSRKNREKNFRFIDEFLGDLIRLGAIHSGYVLDCSSCKLEDWYPIDEVAESYRCRRCLSNEIRPPSPPVSFRLNEALYQAYLNNFAVPTLVLDVLHKSTNNSFIFSPQIKLDEGDEHSGEIDVVALCDGDLTIGEAKSTDRIEKEQVDCLESTALALKARHVVLGTTSRDSCHSIDCMHCRRNTNYADTAFTHGSSRDPRLWGTKEHIEDLRQRLYRERVKVTSICAQDMLSGSMLRNPPSFLPISRQ